MEKLEAYKKACEDVTTAMEIRSQLEVKLTSMKDIKVTSSVTIYATGSDSQFIYGISILNSQITACKELGLDSTSYEKDKNAILEMHSLLNDFNMWNKYTKDLKDYKHNVELLLSNDEKFELLDYPTNPQV